jgi:hypothetical protein
MNNHLVVKTVSSAFSQDREWVYLGLTGDRPQGVNLAFKTEMLRRVLRGIAWLDEESLPHPFIAHPPPNAPFQLLTCHVNRTHTGATLSVCLLGPNGTGWIPVNLTETQASRLASALRSNAAEDNFPQTAAR